MFLLSIVTPEKVFFEAEIKSLVVPGTVGYLGVLSNHAPLITAMKPGRIEFRDFDDKVNLMAVSGGFLEVSNNKATILADAVEKADELISKTDYPCNHLFQIGGIVINGDRDMGSFCSYKRFEHIDLKTGQRKDLMDVFKNS